MKINRIITLGKEGYIAKYLIERKELFGCNLTYTTNDKNSEGLFLDLTKPETFDFKILNNMDLILFLSAISSPDLCKNDFNNSYQINVIGTKYFIKHALEKGAKVLFFSSDVLYGGGEETFDEESKVSPFGEYAKMKYAVESEFMREENFKIFRMSYVLSKKDKFLNYLQNCTTNNSTAEIFHPFFRCAIYINDVFNAILQIKNRWDLFTLKICNLVGTESISRLDIAEAYKNTIDNNLKIKIIKPGNDFFEARPQRISVKSKYLEQLLLKPPCDIIEMMEIEFNK